MVGCNRYRRKSHALESRDVPTQATQGCNLGSLRFAKKRRQRHPADATKFSHTGLSIPTPWGFLPLVPRRSAESRTNCSTSARSISTRPCTGLNPVKRPSASRFRIVASDSPVKLATSLTVANRFSVLIFTAIFHPFLGYPEQYGPEYNGHSEIRLERLLRFPCFLFDEVCVSVVVGYLRHYRRWDETPGKSLAEQRDLVNQVVHKLARCRDGRAYTGRKRTYIVESRSGEAMEWPTLQEAIYRATDEGVPDLLVVIPTLDGVQFNLSFLKLLTDPKCDAKRICVNSGWRRVRMLAQETNHKHVSQYPFWCFVDGCSFTDFENMVERVRQRNKSLPSSVKAGMREAAERGVRLGSQCCGTHMFTDAERSDGGLETALQRQDAAYLHYRRWFPDIRSWRERGRSIGEIAIMLNKKGAKTQSGGPFNRMTVYRILKRMPNPLA